MINIEQTLIDLLLSGSLTENEYDVIEDLFMARLEQKEKEKHLVKTIDKNNK